MTDYRYSHLAPSKGYTYDASFKNLTYRKMVWDWEKDVLYNLINKIRRSREFVSYLDFACGTGRIIEFLEAYVDESQGVDVSPSMLEVASNKVKRSKLILGDITQECLLEKGYFDTITAFRFFLNAQPSLREEVLCAFEKILKPGGYLILNIHMNKGCLLERELKAYRAIKRIKGAGFQTISVQEMKNLLGNFHFDVLQTCHYGIIPIYREERKLFLKEVDFIERICSRYSWFLPISRYVIYVSQLRKMTSKHKDAQFSPIP